MLRLLFTLAVATWFGSIVCVSFVVTPAAHWNFESDEARRFLRPVFPRYYRLGIVCAFAALGAVLLGRQGLPQEELVRLAGPVVIALITTLAGAFVVLPRLQGLDGKDPAFEHWHFASTMLNTTTLGALALAVAGAVMR
ncbi:MAG: hypothetical protein RL698_1118 [Pseudomonadota bacterium]|jgi:hypothetical protein